MLIVVMLGAVMMNVVAPSFVLYLPQGCEKIEKSVVPFTRLFNNQRRGMTLKSPVLIDL